MSPAPAKRTHTSPRREIAIGVVLVGLYLVVAAFSAGRRDIAHNNAQSLLALERWLRVNIEAPLNHWLAAQPVFAAFVSYAYAYTALICVVALLAMLYTRFPQDYERARDSFVVLNLFAIACFVLVPFTAPRLLPELGLTDSVGADAPFGSWTTPLVMSVNELAEMPSLPLAWALWVSLILARLGRGISVQLLSAANVGLTAFAVIATGNTYVLTAAAAVPVVAVSLVIVDRRARSTTVPSADAFFLHVETDAAPQHVGGMVVLAPSSHGAPTLDALRALVRDEVMAAMPRFRQRPEAASRWRRWRWVDVDPDDMDWTWHVIERVAKADNDIDDVDSASAALSEVVAQVAAERMPRDRPMWRVVLVRDVSSVRCGLLFLVHHCVADGIGTVVHALNLLRPRIVLPDTRVPSVGHVRKAMATAAGLAQLATDGRTAAKLPPGSARRQFATATLDLDLVRASARNCGVRVTDLMIALLATAVAADPGFAAKVKQQLRIAVPITVRPPSADIGNATAAVMVDVPLGDLDFDTRLAYVHAESRRLVTPTRVLASRFVMTTVLGVVPAILQRWFARTVYGPTFLQAIVSNMPGPTEATSLLDVPLERVVPILPLAPGAPVALGALSWDGGFGIGIAADPDLLDAAALTTYVQETVNRLSTSLPQRAPRN